MNQVDKLLFDLETIGKIREGDKLSTSREHIVIDDGSLGQSYRRWRKQEDRMKTVCAVRRIVRMVISYAWLLCESKYLQGKNISADSTNGLTACSMNDDLTEARRHLLKKIETNLRASRSGIENLMCTYRADANAVAELTTLPREISECVSAINDIGVM